MKSPIIHRYAVEKTPLERCFKAFNFQIAGAKGWRRWQKKEGGWELSWGWDNGTDVNFIWLVCCAHHSDLHPSVEARNLIKQGLQKIQ